MLAAILAPAGTRLTPEEAAFFREADPWGFILFARNGEDPAQVAALTAQMREAVGREAPVLIDQEGGRVQRFGPPHWGPYLAALDQMRWTRARHGPEAALEAMTLRARLIADGLISCGVDVNCAPLADLVEPETHPILLNRLYGGDVETVVAACRAVIEGQLAQGVLPVLKHVPGYGRASADMHLELSRARASLADLEARELAPFRALRDVPMAMTAHIVVEALDPEAPATVSAKVIDYLRREVGMDGLLMTDDVSMEALSGDVVSRGQASLAAGCDLVLHCNGEMPEMRALAEALPPMGPEALRRAARALAQRRAPEPFDVEAARARLAALTA